MMSVLMLLAGIALGVTLLNPRRRTEASRTAKYPPRVRTIRVKVTYPSASDPSNPDGAPQIVVDPWVAGIGEGDEIDWELVSSNQSDQLRIVPKSSDWPFPGKPPAPPEDKPQKVPAGKVNVKKRDEPYRYDVLVRVSGMCQGNAPRWIRIDPELIVIWDTGTGKY
jgi:hypothetical protein